MSEKFCLRWNDFESSISSAFKDIRDEKDFFDVTLACDAEQLQVHKVILSACSPFFRTVLRRNPHQHPLLYMKGVRYVDLQSVLNFMYHGEVNVAQDDLNSFLAVAEELKVKGLTQKNEGDNQIKNDYTREPISSSVAKEPVLKRPRTSAPQPLAQSSHYQEDDDIQEVLPVKTEPPSSFSNPEQLSDVGGVVAQDEGQVYGDEYADYGYDDPNGGYDESLMAASADGNKDDNLAQLKLSLMRKVVLSDGKHAWECIECGKKHHNKSNIVQHVDLHIQGVQYICEYCQKQFKSQGSLNVHMTTKHRDLKKRIKNYY